MSALVATVLLASLLGSLHCAGMCGPFVAFYAGGDASRGPRRALAHVVYNGGRLASYALLGALAGTAGAAVDLAAGHFAGVQRAAAALAGALIAAWGLGLLLRHFGAPLPRLVRVPRAVQVRVSGAVQALAGRPPVVRALLLGLLAVLLPCGWLYAFAITAAGTGSATGGALVMAVFWLGTLPVMAGVGVGVQLLAAPLRRHAPALCAVALVVVGLLAVAGRLPVIGADLRGRQAVPASVEDAARQARSLPGETPACCAE